MLLLAAVNLGVRLDREVVTEWDEAIYSLSASEMVEGGRWIGTTIHGELDYYNAKPPLNVWLIAASFKLFGQSLVSSRLPSVAAAWLTILGLMILAQRAFGPGIALVAGTVLATNFGFIFVHSGRSANPDAVLALLMLLTVAALWAAHDRPSRLIWLGPLLAGIFLLKGMAALLAMAIVTTVEAGRAGSKDPASGRRWRYLAIASTLFMLPVGAWAALRWQIDGAQFLQRVVYDDFIGHTLDVLDGHAHSPLFYLDLLQKHEFGWLTAMAVALCLCPIPHERWRRAFAHVRAVSGRPFGLVAWAALAIMVPTMMQTKLPWYLNSFYPVFALATAWVLVTSFATSQAPRRRVILGAMVAVVFLAAEARLAWYSFRYRDVTSSVQGLLLAERSQLAGQVVFASQWANAEAFVLQGVVGGRTGLAADLAEFLICSSAGDYLLSSNELSDSALTLIHTDGRWRLYRRQVLSAARSR